MKDTYNYDEFLNEEMSALATNKLRNALHDIIIQLKRKETLNVEDLSKTLATDFKITISPFFLESFLENYLKARKGEKVPTIFKQGDSKWFGCRDNAGTIEVRNNLLYQKPSLSKYKRKLYLEDEAKELEELYQKGFPDLNFNEDIIKKTFVLQRPEDSKDMIKYIYNDIIKLKKYYNTYENCWKLMIHIGNQNKLDRIHGYFKLAPQPVKDYYKKTKAEGNPKVDLELKKIETTNKANTTKKPVSNKPSTAPITEPLTEDNMAILENETNCDTWGEFKNLSMLNLINLVDKMKVPAKPQAIDTFLDQVNELTSILSKFYLVEKKLIYEHYQSIEFDKFVRRWKQSGIRPKISTTF